MKTRARSRSAGAVITGLIVLEIFALVFAPSGVRPVLAYVLAGTAVVALLRALTRRGVVPRARLPLPATAGGRFGSTCRSEDRPADDVRLLPARRAVREAAHRLADDAPALTSAGAEPLRAGLEARANALHQAVLDAYRAGIGREDIARDALLDLSVVDEWTARNGRQMTGHRGR
ncbi:hypothetical protein ACFQ6V_09515 [Streptomyces roseifaciens]